MLGNIVCRRYGLAVATIALVGIPSGLQAQVGQIIGSVVHAETGEALPAVQISVQGTGLGVISGSDGAFTLTNVPVGTHVVVIQRLGYQQIRQEDVVVSAGQSTTLSLTMRPAVLALERIVATGLVDPVEGVRSPISVTRVDRSMMPVMVAGNAVQNLQGRVAGMQVNRSSGQPGTGVSLMLRTPTSVTQTGEPLIVIDGVILGGIIAGPETIDIEGMDIESIEVVRGAAAASLYGSRAAAGVIAITTARGQGLEFGQTRFSARSEMGRTEAFSGSALPRHHHFLMDEAKTTYVDAQGNPVGRDGRVAGPAATSFMDNPYPGPVFDNVKNVYQPGNFESHNFSISQNTVSTNFAVSLNRYVEEGALATNRGYARNSLRINLDHRFVDALSLGTSMYHSRDYRDNIVQGTLFQQILQSPPDIDLSARAPDGSYLLQPDDAISYQNPLWVQQTRDNERRSIRTLASANLRWDPYPWITASGLVSYDRGDITTRNYTAKGIPTLGDDETDGSLSFNSSVSDTWNGEAQVSVRRDFGLLNVRTTFRTLMERDRTETRLASGNNFILFDVPQINNTLPEDRNATSSHRDVRALGYLWDTAFDYDAKYIVSGLIRRDGSSLFGEDNRWHNYYRVAAAWRLSEEDWFDLPNVDEFKLSYARGTAGGRPTWAAQYETWSLTQGIPTKGNLGNKNLRPEHTTEQEVSLDMIVNQRYSLRLTHAWQETTDQLVNANQPAFTGYANQWTNGGTVSGRTTELTLEGQMVQRPNLLWNSMIIADRSTGKIEDWPFPCENPSWRYYCSGIGIYEIWGGVVVSSHQELATHHGGAALDFANEFQVNDDGYLVWVGEGNDFREGVSKGLWGTSTEIGGATYDWGVPFRVTLPDGAVLRTQMGDSSAYNLGWMNNLILGGFTFHAHLHASLGGDAVNRSYQELVSARAAPEMDQAGKPEELKKPLAYYDALFAQSQGSTHFMESGTYLKLRTLSVNYRLGQPQLARIGMGGIGVQSLQIGLIGRNLFTVTSYSGFDPEQALNLGNRQNQDRFSYPLTRSYTAEVSVTF